MLVALLEEESSFDLVTCRVLVARSKCQMSFKALFCVFFFKKYAHIPKIYGWFIAVNEWFRALPSVVKINFAYKETCKMGIFYWPIFFFVSDPRTLPF